MAIENEVWSEIKITVGTKDIEVAGNIANMVVPYGIYIEDYSDLENEVMEIAHIDLIEESLLEADRSKGIIHVYVNPHENPIEAVSFIEERLKEQNIEYSIQIDDCATEDWVNNWKQYFHPMPIGEKLLIRPTWEDEYDAGGRKLLHIEPGLAFGTGSHPTTKLCLETLEKYIDEVNLNDDKDAWFSRIKSICEPCSCTPNVKEYKQNPDNFKGHVGDVSTIIRVALTGRTNTPDLFSITALLGEKRVKERLTKALEYYKENK